jgi:hypothetical protein
MRGHSMYAARLWRRFRSRQTADGDEWTGRGQAEKEFGCAHVGSIWESPRKKH